jgi:hypothetical protein
MSNAPSGSNWPALRRAAWVALFIAIMSWASMVSPPPPPEVLPWTGFVAA